MPYFANLPFFTLLFRFVQQDPSTSSDIVRKRNGIVNVNGRRQSDIEATDVKVINSQFMGLLVLAYN